MLTRSKGRCVRKWNNRAGRWASEAGVGGREGGRKDCSNGESRRQGWGFIQEQRAEPSRCSWRVSVGCEGWGGGRQQLLSVYFLRISASRSFTCLCKLWGTALTFGSKSGKYPPYMNSYRDTQWDSGCGNVGEPEVAIWRSRCWWWGRCFLDKADLIDHVQCPMGQSWILSSAGGGQKQNCSIWRNKWIIGPGMGELLCPVWRGTVETWCCLISACSVKGQYDSWIMQMIYGHASSFHLEICPCQECLKVVTGFYNVLHGRCYWGQVILTSVVFGSSTESISDFLQEFNSCSAQT